MVVMSVFRSYVAGGVAAVLAVAGVTACTSAPQEDAPPAILPGRPGEPASTLAPGQTNPLPSTPPNAADFSFVRDMIVHHLQALEMAALAPQRAATDEIKRLADRITGSQRLEIDAMNDWLRDHGQPEVAPSGHAGHDAQMPGMATAAQLDALRAASGTGFDGMFLQLMITHHEGALAMAGRIQVNGADPWVQKLADDVIVEQNAEINRMRAILGS
jgi:uncharacterized protein (DUF305 family)